jgi:hypothetical protein
MTLEQKLVFIEKEMATSRKREFSWGLHSEKYLSLYQYPTKDGVRWTISIGLNTGREFFCPDMKTASEAIDWLYRKIRYYE